MSTRHSTRLWIVPLCLLAVWLRLTQLDARALWFDEGVSLTFARLPLRDLAKYSVLWVDVNPPAYRALLGLWTDLAGSTALVARLLSVWMGVLIVPLAYRIGRHWSLSRSASLLGALLIALAPVQVYYSREAKGYTLIQCCLLVTVVIWQQLFQARTSYPSRVTRREMALAAGLFLSTAVAIGSHYVAALLIAVTGLWTLFWSFSARRRGMAWTLIIQRAGLWFVPQLLAALVWVPWVAATAQGVAVGAETAAANIGLQPLGPLQYAGNMLLEIAGGPDGPTVLRWLAAVLYLFAALGLIYLPSYRLARWLLASWWLAPILLGFAVQQMVPFFYPRFLLYVSPAVALLAGQGLVSFSGWRPAQSSGSLRAGFQTGAVLLLSALLGCLSANVPGLPGPEVDLRPLAADLTRRVRPGDGLIYSYHWQPGMIDAYGPPGGSITSYPSFFEPGSLDESMQAILDRHGRVWLLTYRIGADDPINDVGRWLLENAAAPGGMWHDDNQLSLFIAPDQVANPGPASTCHTLDNGRIELCYTPLEVTLPAISRGASEGPPVMSLALHWTANEMLPERYVVFVHLVSDSSPVPVAQQDVQPVNGRRPTYEWVPGDTVRDLHAVIIPLEAAQAGERLTILVGLYDADTLARLPVDGGGDSLRIGQVEFLNP